mgnify:CR=1 FL=1
MEEHTEKSMENQIFCDMLNLIKKLNFYKIRACNCRWCHFSIYIKLSTQIMKLVDNILLDESQNLYAI